MRRDGARPAKVVYVIGQLQVGGTEMQLAALLQNLDVRRYEAHVICLSDGFPLPIGQLSGSNARLYALGRERKGRLRTLWDVFVLLRSLSPTIVHAYSYAIRAAIPAAKLAGNSKVVISFRTDPRRWATPFDRLLIGFADLIIENSTSAIQALRVVRKSSEAIPCRVIHNGLDLELFDRDLGGALVSPIPFLTAQKGRVICAVGSLRPVKCFSLLIEAFALLKKRLPGLRLMIVGDGGERASLETLARDLGVQSSLLLCGLRTDIPAILQRSYLGVLSSRHEGLPNAILEYMAARLPVVATDVGGNREAVRDGETGLLVPFGDPQALSDAMLYVLQNPDVARRFGEAGRRRVEAAFTVERMVRGTEAAYESLLASEGC